MRDPDKLKVDKILFLGKCKQDNNEEEGDSVSDPSGSKSWRH